MTTAPTPAPGKKKPKWGCIIPFGIVVVVVVVIVVAAVSGGGSASVTPHVRSVAVLDPNTVRIYIDWDNTNSSAASAQCSINTTVNNQYGDQVNIETNSTSSNGNVAAHDSRLLYQDIGVNAGDAPYVKVSDVSVVDC